MLLEFLLILGAILFIVYRKTAKPSELPPGSYGWPVLGSLLPRDKHIMEYFAELKEKYGNIFTTKWGGHVIVVIADHKLVKKAFKHPDLQGRQQLHSISALKHHHGNAGVATSQGRVWLDNRLFLVRNLRGLGIGSSRQEIFIQEEAAMLVRYFEQQDLSLPIAMDFGINVAVLNLIWRMLAGLRYEADDKQMQMFLSNMSEDFAICQGPVLVLDVLPWLIPFTPKFIYNNYMEMEKLESHRKHFKELALKIIDDHIENLDSENPVDIIDFYLLEIEKQKDDPNTTYKSDHSDLLTLMSDLFLAGSDTTSNMLRWFVLYMALYPEIQQKAQAVLDNEVPMERLPSLEDRPRLPYIDALILDLLRQASLATMGIPHAATADAIFEGYKIPKDTVVMGTLELFHHDPALWEQPNTLYPQHFLDSEGKLQPKHEGFYPFSVGHRQCPGEALARMELYLIGSAILQRFTIEPPPGVQLDISTDKTQYRLNQPRPFKLVLTKRT